MVQGLGFKSGPPVTTGCWREPTEGRAPSPSTLLPQRKVPNPPISSPSLPAADSLPVSQREGPSHLTCGRQSASSQEVSRPGSVGRLQPQPPLPYRCTHGTAGHAESSQIWNGAACTAKKKNPQPGRSEASTVAGSGARLLI